MQTKLTSKDEDKDKDPAVSVRKSQDCGNIQKPACTKGLKRENRNDAPTEALTSLS
jgi:hypothetical protein